MAVERASLNVELLGKARDEERGCDPAGHGHPLQVTNNVDVKQIRSFFEPLIIYLHTVLSEEFRWLWLFLKQTNEVPSFYFVIIYTETFEKRGNMSVFQAGYRRIHCEAKTKTGKKFILTELLRSSCS